MTACACATPYSGGELSLTVLRIIYEIIVVPKFPSVKDTFRSSILKLFARDIKSTMVNDGINNGSVIFRN